MTHTHNKNHTHNPECPRMSMNGLDVCSVIISSRGARKEGLGVLKGARTTMFDMGDKHTTRKRENEHHKYIKKKTQTHQKQRSRTQIH